MGFFDDKSLADAREKFAERGEFKKSLPMTTGRYHMELVSSKVAQKTKPGKNKGQNYFVAEFKVLKTIEAGEKVYVDGDLVAIYEEGGYVEDAVLNLLNQICGGIPDVDDANKFVDKDSDFLVGLPVKFDNFRKTYKNAEGEEKSFVKVQCSGPLTKQEVADNGYALEDSVLELLD